MFDTLAQARTALRRGLPAGVRDAVLAALLPCVALPPIPGGRIAPGGTRFGGAPDLPPDLPWPRQSRPDDVETILRGGSPESAEELRRHLALDLPFAFIGQVDLAEVAATGSAAVAALPAEGRLLFFHDHVLGVRQNGARAARVLWDRTPWRDLAPAAIPPDLTAAAARWREELAAGMAQYGLPAPPPGAPTPYGGPPRAVQPRAALALPSPFAVESRGIPALVAAYSGTAGDAAADLQEAYDALLERHDAPNAARGHHRLLGPPRPVQDDPRYDAVVVTRFGRQHLPSEEWATHRDAVMAEAAEWALLLELDVAHWMGDAQGEGKVFFLIRRADLAARRFEAVVTVYQQT